MAPMSFENLLIIRPVGLEWKKIIGALSIERNMVSCNRLAAWRLDEITQKEFASVIVTWIERQRSKPLNHVTVADSILFLL